MNCNHLLRDWWIELFCNYKKKYDSRQLLHLLGIGITAEKEENQHCWHNE